MSLQEKETLELAQAKMQKYLQDNAVCSMDDHTVDGAMTDPKGLPLVCISM